MRRYRRRRRRCTSEMVDDCNLKRLEAMNFDCMIHYPLARTPTHGPHSRSYKTISHSSLHPTPYPNPRINKNATMLSNHQNVMHPDHTLSASIPASSPIPRASASETPNRVSKATRLSAVMFWKSRRRFGKSCIGWPMSTRSMGGWIAWPFFMATLLRMRMRAFFWLWGS